jgi:CDP-glucose 4,6-dehydratase
VTLFGDTFNGRKVLLTGHTGFKGSWLTAWLGRLGAEVCGYSNGIPTEPSLFEAAELKSAIRHEVGDVRDVARLRGVFQDFRPDFVFHLAAQAIVSKSYSDPFETISTNVMGTASVMEMLRTAEWPCAAVIITSDKAYDNVEWPWGYRETDKLGGKDVYSGSKGAAELVFNSYAKSFLHDSNSPVRVATARAGNVIGGGDWAADRIVADCVRAWSREQRVTIRSPNATRPWQHVLEPLSGYLSLARHLAETRSASGDSYNFGPRGEQNATVRQLLGSLAQIWGFEREEDSFEVTGNLPFFESSLLKLNIDKALLELKWEPNLSYHECMTMTGSWYRDVTKLGGSARQRTLEQIEEYENFGKSRDRVWTRG